MPDTRTLTFGPFRLDRSAERLWRGEEPIALPAKAFAVLYYLVTHAGRLVTRHELLEVVWGTSDISDAALASCIRDVRRALGDLAQTPQFLETVRGRGYRFVAPVIPAQHAGLPGLPAVNHALGPLIGREAELARLHQRFALARQGKRQLVFVSGEAGIGKTTLVDAFLAQIAPAADVWVGRGQCVEQYGAGEAYLPLLEAVGQLTRAPASGGRLAALLRQQAPSWLLQMPALVSVHEAETLQQRVSGTSRERMLRELAEVMEAFTVDNLLVLVLEDLHWGDAATVDWLAYMARRRDVARVLVLGTYRSVEAAVHAHPVRAMVQELQVHGQCTELALPYLSDAAITAYLTQRGEGGPPPSGLARVLHQRTNGNPLFLVTMVEALLRQGVLRQSATGWDIPEGLEAVATEVPESLQQLVGQQVDHLPPTEQMLLEAASVVGKEFAVAAVAAAVERPVDEVERHCLALARRGQFVRASGTDAWPDGTVATRFGFLHDLYRETVYGRLPAGRRVRWHRLVGLRLEQGYGAQTQDVAAELAMHFLQGRTPQQAVTYLLVAGEAALRRSAPLEAIGYLSRGLELLPQWPDTRERAQQELSMSIVLGTALMVTKGWGHADVGRAYARARTLCEQLGDTQRLFPVLAGLWEYANGSAQHALAGDLGTRLLVVAREHADTALLLQAYQALWTTAFNTGAFATAYQYLQDGLALYPQHLHQPELEAYGGHDLGISVRSYAALILWYVGYPDQALGWNDTALTLARGLAHPFTLGHTLVFAAWFSHFRRDVERTSAYAQEALSLGTEQGSQYLVAVSTALRGWALSSQGQATAGLALIRQGIAAWEVIGTPHHRPWFLGCLAEVLGRLGRAEEGLTALAEALDITGATGGRKDEATLYRLRGELRWQAGHPPEAVETCFQQALTIARQQQARPLELRVAMSLGRLWQQHGRRAEARALLAPLYGGFTEGFETADLQEARGLLATLG